MVLQLLCACSIILCFCLLLFSHCFCRCRLVLFHPAVCLFYLCLSSVKEGTDSWACLVFFCLFFCFLSPSRIFYYCLYLISSRVSCYVCHFLWFGFSFLHAVPAADIFYCSLFFFIVFLHISFHFYPLYKRIWAFMDLYQSNGSCTQFAIIYQSHSIEDLYSTANMYSTVDLYSATDHFPLHFFLSPGISVGFCFFSVFFGLFLLFGLFGGPLGFAFYWAFFLMGFWVRIYKNEHQQI